MAITVGPTVSELLRNSRFEILPLDGIEDQVREHLPTDVKVTVTASPREGLEAALDLSERLARAGYPFVPHLSARLVRDRVHLEEVFARLKEAGVRELFVPAGDATEPGEFQGAAELLAAMGEARSQFERIGITGYPESHHLISDEETIRAMFEKAEMATGSSPNSASRRTSSVTGSRTCARAARTCRSGSSCPAAWTRRSSCGSR